MLTMKWLALLLPVVMAMSIRKQNHSLVPASTPVVAVPASIMVLAEKYGIKTPTHEGEYDGIFALLDAILAKAKGSKEAIHSKHDEAKKDAEDAQQAKVDDATAKIDAYNAASDDVTTAKSAMDTSIATREAGITSTADLLVANEDARMEELDATDSEIAVIQDVKETLGGMTTGHSYSRFAFSSCDSTGFDGPGQSACSGVWNDAHVDDVVAKWGITVEEGRQSFTAYQTGTLKIKMAGAQGGEQSPKAPGNFYARGGLPATIEATCKVTKDQVITVVVGQHGEDATSNGAGGGGGGSFIYHSDSQLLVAAGGGGGASHNPTSSYYPSPGQSGDSGSLGHGSNSGCRAGTGGNAGVASSNSGSGCAGAGWNQNAANSNSYCKGGKSRASGFLGGADGRYVYMGQGGFGGGGGGGHQGAGGGGYSGGAGAVHGSGGGGGGGSYVHPSCTTIARTAGKELSAANSQPAQRDGYVTVQYYVDLSEE